MSGEVLGRDSIAQLLQGTPPLIAGFLSLEDQLQPNGFDLTLREISELITPGSMGEGPGQREVSDTSRLEYHPDGWLQLTPGSYLITLNEVVALPLDLMALGRPRSSLLRSGVSIHTAVWDAGYQGRSQALLVVPHPGGYRVQQDARLLQLVFWRMAKPVDRGYQGKYQRENLSGRDDIFPSGPGPDGLDVT
jgi:dUTP pyrophosphatase